MTLEELHNRFIESTKDDIAFAEKMIAICSDNIAKDNDAIKEYRAGGHEMREFLADWIDYRKEDYRERNYWRRKLQKYQRYLYVLESR